MRRPAAAAPFIARAGGQEKEIVVRAQHGQRRSMKTRRRHDEDDEGETALTLHLAAGRAALSGHAPTPATICY